MIFQEFSIKGLVLVKPRVFEDERGFFLECYNQREFRDYGITVDFVQDNHSQSSKHVLRGLHFQIPPHAQDKLIRVVRGEIFDVAVDLRRNSSTFGKWQGVVLSEDNKHLFWIPEGFAHGFVALSEKVDIIYKTTDFYSKGHDCGLIWNDPDVSIDWPISHPVLSLKDQKLPTLKDILKAGVI